MNATTKTFTAWNGDKQLTRDEYIKEWTQPTLEKYCYLFAKHGLPSELQGFIDTIEALAGKEWDKAK